MKSNILETLTLAVVAIALTAAGSAYAAAKTTKPVTEVNATNVKTQYVNVNGVKFAYRRFGNKVGLPLLFTSYLTGTMDNVDPAVLDRLAKDREVIIFDNAGVAGSEGKTPDNIADMAKDAAAFIHAIGLQKIDLLGFSIGGMVAQQLTLDHPELIRRLILIGTGPRGGEGMQDYTPQVWAFFKKTYAQPDELLLDTFFVPTETSQKAGKAYLTRIRARIGKDPQISDKVVPAQLSAIFAWGKKQENSYAYLKEIKQPVLVVSGDQDVIIPPVNSFILEQNLPNASLIIFPDSNHGVQYQYTKEFVAQATMFLDAVK
ncbi:alpha/beta fold hydrolase [Mucilaginibacter polytrichastri]|uniref:AB hydrolase-1 domain-containing protein n=1 Tax=Mucilaginibacter polytrichastri TaxID=1302689 RepID=A0A1Q5ZY77_9SPHI|nr:alpha/beta hydrolase [Mucilaginibacter polytrichastri]OKS86699.1 hypothetical protein RG47T_2156 [Mucilaginibacter polytrichastri]SFS82339.1 Pimeloyl-ACP methyl ester carboxylesterase [Mucilaginibacter polytrichastri]